MSKPDPRWTIDDNGDPMWTDSFGCNAWAVVWCEALSLTIEDEAKAALVQCIRDADTLRRARELAHAPGLAATSALIGLLLKDSDVEA